MVGPFIDHSDVCPESRARPRERDAGEKPPCHEGDPPPDPSTSSETDRLIARDPCQPGFGTDPHQESPTVTQCFLEGRLHRIGSVIALTQKDRKSTRLNS